MLTTKHSSTRFRSNNKSVIFIIAASTLLGTLIDMVLLSSKIRASEEPLRIAVASNFLNTATRVANQYEKNHSGSVELISGSTGKLYAQILNGAPYDIFLAADSVRPKLLAESDKGFSNTTHVYAKGRLALWAPKMNKDIKTCNASLLAIPASKIGLANPRTAPYGNAGMQTLDKLEYLSKIRNKLVFGENVGQVLSYLVTGSVDIGFISLSQVLNQDPDGRTCVWKVPNLYHPELTQSAIVLTSEKASSLGFMEYLLSDSAAKIIRSSGYLVP